MAEKERKTEAGKKSELAGEKWQKASKTTVKDLYQMNTFLIH